MLILGMRAVKLSLKTSLKSPLQFQHSWYYNYLAIQNSVKLNLDVLYVEKKNLIEYLYQYKYFLNEEKCCTIKSLVFDKESGNHIYSRKFNGT